METTILNAETIRCMKLEDQAGLLFQVLSGDLKVQNGALVPKVAPGPRGPTAKVQPRLEACKEAFLSMDNSGVTAKQLLDRSNGQFLYTDILLIARILMEAGTIKESRHGRKATWYLTTGE